MAALAWFDRVWIPTQQQYLNERNLRALRTVAAQIKAKVDNFDQAIDHAIDSFPIKHADEELLKKYVKLFSPELEIVTFHESHPAWTQVPPSDPPTVRILRDEGRNYLYLGYRHVIEHRSGAAPVSLVAKNDLEQTVKPFLTRTEFDALLLADHQGGTIAQRSSLGLELTNVATLRERGEPVGESAKQGELFKRIRGTTGLTIVSVGAADYMLYAQPVQLSLTHASRNGSPEEWTLCGLVRLDKFRAASSMIPTTYWLWFSGILAVVLFGIPIIKLRILSPRERLTRVDSVAIACAVFMLTALAAFAALDLRVFGAIVPAAVDEQLKNVGASIAQHVGLEMQAIDAQMGSFEDESLWKSQLGYAAEPVRTLNEIRDRLQPAEGARIKLGRGTESSSQCEPSWSCRTGVLGMLGSPAYPFFKMMVWNDDAGWQRIKWSTLPVVTPFLNVRDEKLAYFAQLTLARRLSSADSRPPMTGVNVFTSPNTAERLTVFWKAVPPRDAARRPAAARDLIGATLATTPLSLTRPVLPKNVQFAVLDLKGRVLFHTDPARSLTENFFEECEENPRLKSLVASATDEGGGVSGRYLSRPHRFYVRRLGAAPFDDPRWSLVVFQDAAVAETANLQTIVLAASMFVVYALALGGIWAVLTLIFGGAISKWLWPDPTRGLQYRYAAAVGTAIGVLSLGAMSLNPAPALVYAVAAGVLGAAAAMFWIVRREPDSSADPSATWRADCFCARGALLFVLGVIPATLCFQTAFAFHVELVEKRAESHLATELAVRERRIKIETQRTAICGKTDRGSQSCGEVGWFVARRTRATLWDVHVPNEPGPDRSNDVAPAVPALVRWFLTTKVYRAYNDIAADLLMNPVFPPGAGLEHWRISGDDLHQTFTNDDSSTGRRFVTGIAPRSPVDGVFWLIALGLAAATYALARYVHAPLFALDLNAPAPLLAGDVAAADACLLVTGPSALARTERLQRHPRVRVFDVRSLSFLDDPAAVAPLSPVQATAAAEFGEMFREQTAHWPDAILQAVAQPLTIVAIDHLEHRLDDREFRASMLECLESAVYARGAAIWCSAHRDPVEVLDRLTPPARDRRRWVSLLERFRREQVGFEIDRCRTSALEQFLATRGDRVSAAARARIAAECKWSPELLAIGERLAYRLPADAPVSDEDALAEIGLEAARHYETLWDGCSIDERVALRQLAEEGLVNPNNSTAIARLLSVGLVQRASTLRIMNETFRRFVIAAATPRKVAAWEHEGVRVPWGTIATTGVTVAFGLAGLLLLTQEQLVDAWISYVPALAPAIPTVWRVIAAVQRGVEVRS